MLSLYTLGCVIASILLAYSFVLKQHTFLLLTIPFILLFISLARRKFLFIMLLLCVIAFSRSYLQFQSINANTFECANNEVLVIATVSDYSKFSEYPRGFEVHKLIVNGKNIHSAAFVYHDGSLPPPFSQVEIRGRMKKKESITLAGKIVGQEFLIYAKSVNIVKKSFLWEFVNRTREKMIKNVMLTMKSRESLLLLATTAGVKTMSGDEMLPFYVSGTAHIFAISGLHLSIIHSICTLVFFGAPLFGNFVALGLILVFLLVVGLRISALRAFIMYFFIFLGRLVGRGRNALNLLFCAAAFISLLWPDSIFSISFYLSFVSMLGLLVIPDMFKSGRDSSLHSLLISTISTQITILPLTIYFFNTIPLISTAANMLTIPLFYLLQPLGMLQSVFAMLDKRLSTLLAPVSNFFFLSFRRLIEFASATPFSHVYVASNLYFFAILVILTLLIICAAQTKKRRMVLLLLIGYLLTMTLFVIFPKNAIFTASTRNEQILILKRHGISLVATVKSKQGASNILSLEQVLRKAGTNEIDLLFICHPVSESEWSDALNLVQEKRVKVRNIYVVSAQNKDELVPNWAHPIRAGTIVKSKDLIIRVFENRIEIDSFNEKLEFPGLQVKTTEITFNNHLRYNN